MEFFFADDSSQKASRKGMGTVLAFGGILVPADLLADMKDEVDRVATEFGIPECEEIKWSPNKGSWIYQNLHGDQRKNCYQKLLEAAKDSKCSVIVVAWDLEKSELKRPEALEMVYNYTFERVTNQLNAKKQTRGHRSGPPRRWAEGRKIFSDILSKENQLRHSILVRWLFGDQRAHNTFKISATPANRGLGGWDNLRHGRGKHELLRTFVSNH